MRLSFNLAGVEFWCALEREGSSWKGHVELFPEIVDRGIDQLDVLRRLKNYVLEKFDYTFRTKHQFRVDVFMQLMSKVKQQQVRYYPTDKVSDNERLLRARLIIEEALELINKGLGIRLWIDSDHDGSFPIEMNSMEFQVTAPVDLEQVIDGCADLKVVTTGTQSCFGIADEVFQRIVDLNNLEKFGPGHFVDEHGKLNKPPGFKGPSEAINQALLQERSRNAQRSETSTIN